MERIPPQLEHFAASELPPLPTRSGWSRLHRVQVFAGPLLWFPDDRLSENIEGGFTVGAEMTGGLLGVLAYRLQLRMLVDLVKADGSTPIADSPNARDMVWDVGIGARAHLPARLFLGLAFHAGLRWVQLANARIRVGTEGYTGEATRRGTAGVVRGLAQAGLEFGWLLGNHFELRLEATAGKPLFAATLTIAGRLWGFRD